MAGSLLPHWHGLSLNKGHGAWHSHVGFCQLHPTGPATPPVLPAWPSWHQHPGSFSKKHLCWPPVTPAQSVSYWPLWVRCFFEVMLELLNNPRVWGVLTKWEINRYTLYCIKAKVTIKWIGLFSRGKNVPLDILCHILKKYISLMLGINYFKIKKWNFVAQLRIKKVNPLEFLLFGWTFLWQFWLNFTNSSVWPGSAFSANAVLCSVLSTPNWCLLY